MKNRHKNPKAFELYKDRFVYEIIEALLNHLDSVKVSIRKRDLTASDVLSNLHGSAFIDLCKSQIMASSIAWYPEFDIYEYVTDACIRVLSIHYNNHGFEFSEDLETELHQMIYDEITLNSSLRSVYNGRDII